MQHYYLRSRLRAQKSCFSPASSSPHWRLCSLAARRRKKAPYRPLWCPLVPPTRLSRTQTTLTQTLVESEASDVASVKSTSKELPSPQSIFLCRGRNDSTRRLRIWYERLAPWIASKTAALGAVACNGPLALLMQITLSESLLSSSDMRHHIKRFFFTVSQGTLRHSSASLISCWSHFEEAQPADRIWRSLAPMKGMTWTWARVTLTLSRKT